MGVLVAVLTTVINFILRILTFAAKLIYKLFRVFGLHIPLLYLIVMLIIELATGRGISANPEYLSLFWLGLVLSLLLAAWHLVRRIFYPKRKRDEAYYRKKFERELQLKQAQEPVPAPETAPEAPALSQSVPTAEIPAEEPLPELPPFMTAQTTQTAQTLQNEPEDLPQPAPEPLSFSRRGKEPRAKKSRPHIYRVRQDERFLIYEYNDRTELYLERADGLKLIRTDRKE